MEISALDEHYFTETLVNVLRRYVFYVEERDIEEDIQRDMNELYLLNNYSSSMTNILKSVSKRRQHKRSLLIDGNYNSHCYHL